MKFFKWLFKRTRNMSDGFMIINYTDLLYPQYLNDRHFPSIKTLFKNNKKHLKERAEKLLEENKGMACYEVTKHWESLC